MHPNYPIEFFSFFFFFKIVLAPYELLDKTISARVCIKSNILYCKWKDTIKAERESTKLKTATEIATVAENDNKINRHRGRHKLKDIWLHVFSSTVPFDCQTK